MTRIKFSGYMFISAALIASAFIFTGIASATMENKSNEGGSANYFSKIYVDGFNANSNGFKLLLRTYERRMDTYFQPFLVDVDFSLIDEGKIVYQDTLKQVSLLSDRQGTTEITNQAHIALKEGRNYTALAKIYLHDGGVPRYYLTATSYFIAKNDAAITEVYGDGIGASATIKSKSMVPLNASITFTLTQDGRILETKEITAPSIMSHDKEKTVNVLWTNRLEEGVYVTSVLLKGTDIPVNYDKIFTVKKKTQVTSPVPATQTGSSHSLPGFSSVLAAIAIFALAYRWRN